MSRAVAIMSVVTLLAAVPALAQEAAPGPGTVEVTIIPGGATFFTSKGAGPEFGNYTYGGALAVNFNRYVGIEGEVGGTIGIAQDLTFRGSYGTGFLPPSINQIVPGNPTSTTATLIDPKRGSISAATGPFDLVTGGNPTLVPEESRSWSFGMIFTPRFVENLRVSIDYTNIQKTDEIGTFASVQQALDLEDLIPGRITRAPLNAQDQALGYTAGAVQRTRPDDGPLAHRVEGRGREQEDLSRDGRQVVHARRTAADHVPGAVHQPDPQQRQGRRRH